MDKKEQILRERAIRDYLEGHTIEILENIETVQKKQDKIIAKLF
ncbi:unnamed protein product [marine sediment metagenome]|uniref:Uncharacterized protein n=1 Tax=marine sediment metagenome TaxID=412755 RepID=X1B001_9ZZZZ